MTDYLVARSARAFCCGLIFSMLATGISSNVLGAPAQSHIEAAYAARGYRIYNLSAIPGMPSNPTGSWTHFSIYDARIKSGQLNIESRWDIEPTSGASSPSHGLIERAHGWFTIPDFQPNPSDPTATVAYGKMFCYMHDPYHFSGAVILLSPSVEFQPGLNVDESHRVINHNKIQTSLRRDHCKYCESSSAHRIVCSLDLLNNYGEVKSDHFERTLWDPPPPGWSTHPAITEIRAGAAFTDGDPENKVWVWNQTARVTSPNCGQGPCDPYDDATTSFSTGDSDASGGVVVWGGGGWHKCRGDLISYDNRTNRCEKPSGPCTIDEVGDKYPSAANGSWYCVGVRYNCWDTPNHEAPPPAGVGLSYVGPVPETEDPCGACDVFNFFEGSLEDALSTVATHPDDWRCPANAGHDEVEIFMPGSSEWPVEEWRLNADIMSPPYKSHIERYNGWARNSEGNKRCWGEHIGWGITYQWVQVYDSDHPTCVK